VALRPILSNSLPLANELTAYFLSEISKYRTITMPYRIMIINQYVTNIFLLKRVFESCLPFNTKII
jgi:hypothetical protein